MEAPLVSVIVPNYNYAPYLDVRMESILNQTYQNFEVIILDDHSTDHSLAVLEKYKSHPKVVKMLVNDANSGSPFNQWERGIKEASGDIIWIAESDDTCSSDFLETLVTLYVTNGSVLAFCHSVLIDENGHPFKENNQMRHITSDLSMDGKEFIKKYLAFSNEVQNASCAIFSKQAALEIDKHYMDFKGAGDWSFWIKLCERGSVSFACAACNYYRLHSNTTRQVVKSGLEFQEMKTIYEWLLKHQYLDDRQFHKCRRDNLYLILSQEGIPPSVQKKLFLMWNASSIQVFIIRLKFKLLCAYYGLK